MNSRSRHVDVGKRLLEHLANRTTDSAEDVKRIPVAYYLDPKRWQREMDNIFKRLPLMLAFTTELKEPGTYKAMDVVGVPILLLRGRDGVVRAFMNVCSHRGSRLKHEGIGHCRRIVCPYHAWTYDDRGDLVGIFEAGQFGDLDLATKSLTQLPCEERVGLVFVGLTPGRSLDLNDYLGDMLDELSHLGIEDWVVYTRRELDAANWKVVHDG